MRGELKVLEGKDFLSGDFEEIKVRRSKGAEE